MKLIDYLVINSRKSPNKIAIICGKKSLTYAELIEKIKNLSFGMQKMGIKKNDHIMVILNNSFEFFFILYAAANIGAVVIPTNGTLNKKDLINQIKLTDAKYIVCWHAILKEFLNDKKVNFPISKKNCIVVGNSINGCTNFNKLLDYQTNNYALGSNDFSEDTNFIFGLTSGSTSKPKAVVFSQKTKILRSIHAKNLYKLNAKDIIIVSTPMYHSISQRLLILPVILGGTCVIMEKFTFENWFLLVHRHKVTFSILVASQLELILTNLKKNKYKIESLKKIVSCCSHLKNTAKLKLSKQLNCEIHDTYGASEVGTVTDLNINKNTNKSHTLGKAAPDVEIIILNEFKKKQKQGQHGEIFCKSLLRFSGYYKSKNIIKNEKFKDYFYTGDVGYLDDDNYLILTGRKKDVIITGGINVYALDLENVLNSHSKIKESAVIGIKDKRLGEAILAVIITNKNVKLDLKELKRFCLENLADYQQPLAFDFVNNFPRGSLNKISKYKLKQKYMGADLSKQIRNTLNNLK